ncbi:hypothetical protein CLOSTHATH_05164 [Hungatella hathewayi DSM 13479]|uniref:Uncharacterized protein n=1 Tax=Hungatella hathewayi DSM 13479 TaxID=566550 RepID=D3ANG4_9FIRM|nr:hypothetical protein CLOSTHATH_05164 [Hungatella hathewayi DSM 13479]
MVFKMEICSMIGTSWNYLPVGLFVIPFYGNLLYDRTKGG